MAFGRREDDAPRVVGFVFPEGLAPAAPEPASAPVPPAPVADTPPAPPAEFVPPPVGYAPPAPAEFVPPPPPADFGPPPPPPPGVLPPVQYAAQPPAGMEPWGGSTLTAAPPMPGTQLPGWQPPAFQDTPLPPARGGSKIASKAVAALLVGVVAYGGWYGVRRVLGPGSITAPATLGGFAQMTSADMNAMRDRALAGLKEDGAKSPVVAVYGTPGRTRVILAAHATRDNAQLDWAFQRAMGGLTAKSGVTAQNVGPVVVPGADPVYCGQLNVITQASVCIWDGKRSQGYVIALQSGVAGAAGMAAEARKAIEG